jgi:hypothetical protein
VVLPSQVGAESSAVPAPLVEMAAHASSATAGSAWARTDALVGTGSRTIRPTPADRSFSMCERIDARPCAYSGRDHGRPRSKSSSSERSSTGPWICDRTAITRSEPRRSPSEYRTALVGRASARMPGALVSKSRRSRSSKRSPGVGGCAVVPKTVAIQNEASSKSAAPPAKPGPRGADWRRFSSSMIRTGNRGRVPAAL